MLLLLARVVFAIVITLDELVRPLYRPLVRRISRLPVARAFERWVGGLSPYLILGLIGVPYVVVEPAKFIALYMIAHGHAVSGALAFLLANLVSFVLIERIFSAGRAQLMTLRPMAWLVETAGRVRRAVVAALHLEGLRTRLRAIRRWLRQTAR